jgi:ketosteroid isomerase-like protein
VDAKQLLQRSVDTWNERDHDAWTALYDADAFELQAPGGLRAAGPEAVELVWTTWNGAFPDNKIGVIGAHGERDVATHEGLFEGTHTGPLIGAAGSIEATGASVSLPFVMVYRSEEGKITGLRLYFDQLELMTQLGVAG